MPFSASGGSRQSAAACRLVFLGTIRMPRARRIHVSGGLYHVILRGNHQQRIFDRDTDYYGFEDLLARALTRYNARVHAYCWMTNHVHLAVQVGDARLGRLMQAVSAVYARRKQRRVQTTGHFFERRYRAALVDTDAYWLALVRYVHRNPVEAGIVSDPADYPWSSHPYYLGRGRREWLTVEPTLAMFGKANEAIAAYSRFVGEPVREDALEAAQPSTTARTGKLLPGFEFRERRQPDPRSLEQIVLAVAAELAVDHTLLRSAGRDPTLVRARLEITRRALAAGVASLAEVSARLGRAPSTLSEQLNR
jgi:REP element-mobilizing transposase RayT